MSKYAAQTIVPVDRSKAEIEKILMRYGASSFAYGWEGSRAMVGFQMNGRRIVFKLGMPLPDEFGETPTGKARCDEAILRTHSQACRQR